MRTEEIINRVQKRNIEVYRTHLRAEIINQGVEIIDFSDFLDFAYKSAVQSMFLQEIFDSIDDYYITEEHLQMYDDYAISTIDKEIKKYNNNLQGIDFEVPVLIILACVVDGIMFYTIFENEICLWGEPLISAEERIEEFLDEYNDEISAKKDQWEIEIQRLKLKLKQIVLLDEDFHRCTNKHLRYSYLCDLYDGRLNGEYSKLKQYWESAGLGMFTKDAEDFIELVWREYRDNK